MMFKRIDHVEIVTDQLDRTVQFYIDVLGFTMKSRDRIERSGLGVPIERVPRPGGTVVELISYEGAPVDPAPQTEHLGYRMIALEVDDMQNAADHLKTKGVDIVWGPKVRETYSRRRSAIPTATASNSGSGSGEVGFTGRRWDIHEIEADARRQVLPAMNDRRLTLRSVETRFVSIPLKRPVVSKLGLFDR
jgi:glyoxylase I family protein